MHRSGFTFGKNEKLCSRKIIDQLFLKGETFLAYPLRIRFLPTELPGDVPVQVMFQVSKKRFKQAVKRNLLKRRMRESYRLNKPCFIRVFQERNLQIAVAFLYIAEKELDYHAIEKGMKKALLQLIEKTEGYGNTSQNI
ncbi:MAG: ribonuclease [Anaerophaga sp.]|nr:ribonuclease [Anaerophaga sp.]MDI3521242.1 ribonuclease protein component [Anaerophaga sp.]MDK2840624.1 ribonuclease protein component [Anaerophaga sp.]MDN5290917.1 ribonuclease protein component [Anaerophaga sp.]